LRDSPTMRSRARRARQAEASGAQKGTEASANLLPV
jgi:hypothetical protein